MLYQLCINFFFYLIDQGITFPCGEKLSHDLVRSKLMFICRAVLAQSAWEDQLCTQIAGTRVP